MSSDLNAASFKDYHGFTFGTAKRSGLSPMKYGPGPGHYRIRTTFADVPLYLIPN